MTSLSALCASRSSAGTGVAVLCAAFGFFAVVSHGEAKPKREAPAVAAKPLVVAFTGYVPANDTIRGSSVEKITDQLRERGLAAEVHAPNDWSAVAEELVGTRRPDGPLILVGYSMGAGSATKLAARVAEAGIPVRKLVIVEAWNPTPIAANVERAIHFYASGMASSLVPGAGFAGSLENVQLSSRIPNIEASGHVAMSHLQAVQDLVVNEVMASAAPARAKGAAAKRK